MSNFQQNLLNHLKLINNLLSVHGLEASVRLPDMRLRVAAGRRELNLFPHFVQAGRDRKMQLVPDGSGKGAGFAGWLPSRGVRWPEMSSKLAFRRRALGCGVRVPEHFGPGENHGEVLVKTDRMAYVEGLRGPYAALSGADGRVSQGEYCERFIVGRNLRVWCWRGRPVCAEFEAPASVTGDGRSSVRSLVQKARRNAGYRVYVEDIAECMAARAGYLLDDVLPAGTQLVVDFRYGSALQPRIATDENVWPKLEVSLANQVREAAATMLAWVPADARMTLVFALDAVVDADGLAWWLNMEADPLLHPAVYPPMLADLLGLRETGSKVGAGDVAEACQVDGLSFEGGFVDVRCKAQ